MVITRKLSEIQSRMMKNTKRMDLPPIGNKKDNEYPTHTSIVTVDPVKDTKNVLSFC